MSNKINSNVELDKKIEPVFDYGNITDRDKFVVEEVINLLEKRIGVPTNMIVEELKLLFKIVSIPMMKIDDSLWYKFTKDEKLGISIQGFRETVDEKGKKIKIPHISFSSDLDYLDKFIEKVIKTGDNIKKLQK